MKRAVKAAARPVLKLFGAEGPPLSRKEIASLATAGVIGTVALCGGGATLAYNQGKADMAHRAGAAAPAVEASPTLAAGCPNPDDPRFQVMRKLLVGRLTHAQTSQFPVGTLDKFFATEHNLTRIDEIPTMQRVTAAPNDAAVIQIMDAETSSHFGFHTTRGAVPAPLGKVKQDARDLLADLQVMPTELVRASGLQELQMEVDMPAVDPRPGIAGLAYKDSHLIRLAPGYGGAFSHELGHHLRWASMCESGTLTPLTQFNPPDFSYRASPAPQPSDFKGAIPDSYSGVSADEDYADTASHLQTPKKEICTDIATEPLVTDKTAMVATEMDMLVYGAGTYMVEHMAVACAANGYRPRG